MSSRNICLLVTTANHWSRQVLKGVAQYASEHCHWEFQIERRGYYDQLTLPRNWRGDGIITRLTHPGLARSIRRRGIPAVNTSWLGKHDPMIPKVIADGSACGLMVAKHFAEKGFRSFAYVGPKKELGYVDDLGDAFRRMVMESGLQYSELSPNLAQCDAQRKKQRKLIADWLKRLSLPVGILVWDSVTGQEVTSICSSLRLKVPNDVAVVCAEHDPLLSSLAPTSLSHVDQAPMHVGYQAASLLDRLMDGEAGPRKPILIPPIDVVECGSSDTTAVDDGLVASAMSFIQSNIDQPIQVIDLEKALDVSRRVLEVRFNKTLGYTPAAAIRRTRLDRCKRLLIETDLSISRIASLAGFNHPEVLSRTFSRELGTSPAAFRAMGKSPG